MAAVTFSYRSKKDKAQLEIRLSFRSEGENLHPNTGKEMPFSYYTRSDIEVSKDFWNDYKKGTSFRDAEKVKLKDEIEGKIKDLRDFILAQFTEAEISLVDKEWLKNQVKEFKSPKNESIIPELPEQLIPFFDFYLTNQDFNKRTFQRWQVVRGKIENFQKLKNRTYNIIDVNDEFLNEWKSYSDENGYAVETTKKEFSFIKAVCRYAKRKELKVSPDLDYLRIKLNKSTTSKKKVVFLSFEDLDKIDKLDNLPPYLENARDWLLISCYTGQRISDFMRFHKSMIRNSKGKTYLDIVQVKTGKDVTIPVLPKVIEILNKRGGEFPHRISDQRYNDYIKEVAKLADLTKPIEGGLMKDNRKRKGKYPKWQLITSHIGRRSFASNFYGKLPTSNLRIITGHGTEKMLLVYIGKSEDTEDQSYDLMIKATENQQTA